VICPLTKLFARDTKGNIIKKNGFDELTRTGAIINNDLHK